MGILYHYLFSCKILKIKITGQLFAGMGILAGAFGSWGHRAGVPVPDKGWVDNGLTAPCCIAALV
jgi:hypothetical protein